MTTDYFKSMYMMPNYFKSMYMMPFPFIDTTEKVNRPENVLYNCTYRGEVVDKFPDNPKNGDIVTSGANTYIYYDERWELCDASDTSSTITAKEPQYEILNRCESCGAPTDIHGTCHYCGTINRRLIKY